MYITAEKGKSLGTDDLSFLQHSTQKYNGSFDSTQKYSTGRNESSIKRWTLDDGNLIAMSTMMDNECMGSFSGDECGVPLPQG